MREDVFFIIVHHVQQSKHMRNCSEILDSSGLYNSSYPGSGLNRGVASYQCCLKTCTLASFVKGNSLYFLKKGSACFKREHRYSGCSIAKEEALKVVSFLEPLKPSQSQVAGIKIRWSWWY